MTRALVGRGHWRNLANTVERLLACTAGCDRAAERGDGDAVPTGAAERHLRQSELVQYDAVWSMQETAAGDEKEAAG